MKEKIRHHLSQALLLLAYIGVALVYLVLIATLAHIVLS